jgi:PEP-CTERM motif
MDRTQDRSVIRAFAFFLLVAVTSIAAPTASAVEIGYLQLSSYPSSGAGYVKYDRSSLDPFYDLRDAWRECGESSDPAACDGLPTEIDFHLKIIDAKFTWLDTVFTSSDKFDWFYGSTMDRDCAPDWYGCSSSLFITIETRSDYNYIWVDCYGDGQITDAGLNQSCGEYYRMEYYVGGRGGNSGYFSWREATPPPSVPEPTAPGLIGLVALGLARRSRKAASVQ